MTNKNKWIIVESKMVTGRIKLGAYKELSRKSLSRDQLEGFFYGGSSDRQSGGKPQVAGSSPARQHLILQTIWIHCGRNLDCS